MSLRKPVKPTVSHQSRRIHFLLLTCSLLLSSVLCIPHTTLGGDPGEGEGAKRGYDACAPIIEALDEYYSLHGEYPESLSDLVPAHIDQFPLEVNGDPIIYHKEGDVFTLSFSYSGPGNNICIYSPEDGWYCSGVY